MKVILFIVLWIICGILSQSLMLGLMDIDSWEMTKIDYLQYKGISCGIIIFGPVGLLINYLFSGFGSTGFVFFWYDYKKALDIKERIIKNNRMS